MHDHRHKRKCLWMTNKFSRLVSNRIKEDRFIRLLEKHWQFRIWILKYSKSDEWQWWNSFETNERRRWGLLRLQHYLKLGSTKLPRKMIHVTLMDIKARKSKLSRYNSYVVVLRKTFRILSLTAKFSVRRYATVRNGSRLNFIISTTEKITASYMEVSDDVAK